MFVKDTINFYAISLKMWWSETSFELSELLVVHSRHFPDRRLCEFWNASPDSRDACIPGQHGGEAHCVEQVRVGAILFSIRWSLVRKFSISFKSRFSGNNNRKYFTNTTYFTNILWQLTATTFPLQSGKKKSIAFL